MITLGIRPGPRKVANMMSFLDAILKEIDACSKNGFALERDGQVLYKGNVFFSDGHYWRYTWNSRNHGTSWQILTLHLMICFFYNSQFYMSTLLISSLF